MALTVEQRRVMRAFARVAGIDPDETHTVEVMLSRQEARLIMEKLSAILDTIDQDYRHTTYLTFANALSHISDALHSDTSTVR